MLRTIFVVVSVALLAAGCSDEITNNYYEPIVYSGITGRVIPVDTGTATAIGSVTKTVEINEQGFFTFTGLPDGTYHVIVNPDNYSRREFFDVASFAGYPKQLGEIELSDYPYPVFATNPADGDDSVRVSLYSQGPSVTIYADERLNMDDLVNAYEIDPPTAGIWQESPSSRSMATAYRFTPTEKMHLGTEYTMTIDGTVKTAENVPLGSDIQFSFTTEPLSVSIKLPQPTRLGGIPIRDFFPTMSFNGYVDPDSIVGAVSSEPEIPGIWFPVSSSENDDEGGGKYSRFSFFPMSLPLDPLVDYTITVDAETGFADGVSLLEPYILEFTTERLGVTSVYPPDGHLTVYQYSDIRLTFNAVMDHATTEAAFTLEVLGGETVGGSFTWALEYGTSVMIFGPTGDLIPGTLYKLSLSSSAQTASGENLTEDYESLFGTRQ